MKILLILLVTFLAVTHASGQGQIFFNNRVVGVVVAPVYGPYPNGLPIRLSGNATTNGGTVNYSGLSLVSGTNFTAQLWYAPVGSSMDAFQPVTSPEGTVPFRSTAATAGFIQNSASAATLNGIPFGSQADLQMRVWYNNGGTVTSYAQALASAGINTVWAAGYSDVFTSPVLAGPPELPPFMVGLTSFNIQGNLVPEPSVVALGVLCLGTLLLRWRHGRSH